MDKIVFWRDDTNDHYIHESPACPELRKAQRVKSGTLDVARKLGRHERCPYCKNGVVEYNADKVLVSKGEPRTMRVNYAVLMALAAACFVWVLCYGYFDTQAKIDTEAIYNQGYAAAQEKSDEVADEQYRAGYDAGKKSGYDYGQKEGYNSGYTNGYSAGKSTANSAVDYNRGYDTGYKVGVAEGKKSVDTSAAYNNGYNQGYSDGAASAGQSYQPEQTTSYTVYITATGSKYHSYGCSYLRNSCYSIDINDAIAQGYTPCSRCNP